MATANQDVKKILLNERSNYITVWMSSGGLINTCHGCTKDFSEISTAPFDPQIALAMCPTNILCDQHDPLKTYSLYALLFLVVFFAWIHNLYSVHMNMVSSHHIFENLNSYASNLFSTGLHNLVHPTIQDGST